MATRYRGPKTTPPDRLGVPRLELDVMHRPRHYDVKHRRAQTDRDHYRRPPKDRELLRGPVLTTRDSTYGYDRDYVKEYDVSSDGELDAARVRMYTHDSSDPYSCMCYPRASSKTIPSMMYDEVRCPHPEHKYQPGTLDVFTYPWTNQSFRPNIVFEFGYQRGQIKPPSAVTAPPFALYNAKENNPKKGNKSPPYTAPEKPVLSPLLSAKPSDRQLRRVDRQRVAATAGLATVAEDVSPFDSVSQRAPRERSARPPSLRLRTVDTPVLARVESELRAHSPHWALSTPPARPVLDNDGFPQTPNRIFKGEYVDSGGQKYQYDIKYGKTILDGKRTRLQTL